MSLKSVLVCTRPEKGQGLTTPRTQGVEGANPTPQDTLSWATEFYGLQPTKGGEGFATLPPKSGGSEAPPVILTDTVNLARLRCLPFQKSRTCNPKYIVLQCACGRQIVPSTCMNRDCTICGPQVGKKRSESVFRRLYRSTQYQSSQEPYKTIIYTIFTIPVELRHKYLDSKVWSRLRGKVWKMLKAQFGGLYGVEVSHPHGDRDPTLFHPHLNFLWVQRKGYRPFIPTEKLRNSFAQLVGTETVNVRTQYSHWVRQVKHWCNYVCRTFPGNSVWTGPVRWFGKYPRDAKPVPVTCPECGSHFKRIGWIPKWIVDQYYEKDWITGLPPPWEDDKNIFLDRNPRGTKVETREDPRRNPV